MKRFFLSVLLVQLFVNCADEKVNSNHNLDYFQNGNIKSKTFNNEEGDSIVNYFEFHKNIISSMILKKNDSLSYQINFYSDKKVKSKGNLFLDSLRTGTWKFYNSKGYIDDVREYLIINKSSYLNQRWVFNSKGDTIRGNFFEKKFRDTILLKERNRFHFFLKEPLLSNKSQAYVILPKKGQSLKKDFSNKNEIHWDTIFSIGIKNSNNMALKERKRDVIFDVFSNESGDNELIGIFIEKEIKDRDTIDFITRDIYFNIPYYVKTKASD